MGNAQSYVVNGFFWVLAKNSDIAKAIRYDVPESKIGIARGMHKTGVVSVPTLEEVVITQFARPR